MPDAAAARVAVIGGGWAGCAAAVTLAAAGIPVTLFEQARTLGGRARRVAYDGIALDNGQHIAIGAYRQTLALLESVHGASGTGALFHRFPLALRPFGGRRRGGIELAAVYATENETPLLMLRHKVTALVSFIPAATKALPV